MQGQQIMRGTLPDLEQAINKSKAGWRSLLSRRKPILPPWFLPAKLLHLPGSPLKRWPYWSLWRSRQQHQAGELAVIFAASLRESFEEMRLNPLGVKLLGMLPSQQLVMFHRIIYPLVCWIPRQKRFRPNWEVEKIVYIPLRNLLDSKNYARYRLNFERIPGQGQNPDGHDFPCFVHRDGDETENLWGATFRITMAFLEVVFEFKPPDMDSLPIVNGTLDKNYLTGGEGWHYRNHVPCPGNKFERLLLFWQLFSQNDPIETSHNLCCVPQLR